jgi:hypothetical protein
MFTEIKCPKCGGLDGYEQIKNVVRGAGWFVSGKDLRVFFCRTCDVEMIKYEVNIPKTANKKLNIRDFVIFSGLIIGLILLFSSWG